MAKFVFKPKSDISQKMILKRAKHYSFKKYLIISMTLNVILLTILIIKII